MPMFEEYEAVTTDRYGNKEKHTSRRLSKQGWWTILLTVLVAGGSIFYGIAVLVLTERVPFGHVGVKMTASGIAATNLGPGNYWVWGRDRLAIIELKEQTVSEQMQVLCKDDLNFGVDVKVRVQPKSKQDWETLLTKQGSQIKWDGSVGTLPFDALYATYTRPSVRAATREVVSKFETTQINQNRAQIPRNIEKLLAVRLQNTPMNMTSLETSNFDFPKIVTAAVAKAKEREMEIREETARAEIARVRKENDLKLKLMDAENRIKVAARMLDVRRTEAEAEAIYMTIIGRSVTDKYVRIRQVESQIPFWKQAGANSSMVITDGSTPLMLST